MKKVKSDPWVVLVNLIKKYAEAEVAYSWKGGGDPGSYATIDAQLALAKAKLTEHITVMRRQFDD